MRPRRAWNPPRVTPRIEGARPDSAPVQGENVIPRERGMTQVTLRGLA